MMRLRCCKLWFALVSGIVGGMPLAHADVAAKTLTRFHDPVIVETAGLASLRDHQTTNYRLFSSRSGTLVPIPFQFDQRDDEGEMVLPAADEPPDFAFDDNDELVFMAKDTGDRVSLEALPAGNDSAAEIEVKDTVDGGVGWVYLVHFSEHPPAPSPEVYATFDSALNQARSLFYTIDYAPGRNYFTAVRISAAAGGNGQSLVDRMTVDVNPTFSMLLTSWSPHFTEESFAVSTDGLKNGPVRAIRRVRQSLDLGKFFPEIPSGTTYTYYYFSSFTTPSKFSIPWLPLKLLRAFRFAGVSELGEHAIGMEYRDGANPQGLRFDGSRHSNVETNRDHEWYALSAAEGTCLHVFVIPEKWRKWGIARGTVFRDGDVPEGEATPDHAGREYAVGYSLLNMTNLREPGTYDMNLAVIFLPNRYRPGDEVQPLAMVNRPLRTEVRVQGRASGAGAARAE